MNPNVRQSTSPIALVKSLVSNRQLILQMIRREVVGRYRGSVLGIFWSFFNPLFMLVVYTFVFSVVFKAKWGTTGGESKLEFAVLLFVGMIVHALCAEVLNRAPGIIQGNVNFVKKVVFPLEILVPVALGSALFHAIISLLALLSVFFIFNGFICPTTIFLPVVWLPLVIATVGFAWMLASLGVFLRDIGQLIGIVTTVMMFLAPVFYPLSAIPKKYQIFIMANPLTFIIVQSRNVLIWNKMPDWYGLSVYTVISLAILWLGYWWFQKTRKGFADVL